MFGPCFVMQYLVSFLVLQSSRGYIVLLMHMWLKVVSTSSVVGDMWLKVLCVSSSRCHAVVFSV